MQRASLRAAAVGIALLMGMAGSALADTKDYEFQLLDKAVKQGAAVISVKLVHMPSGRAIADAVIFAKRIDMGPGGMEMMTAPIEAVSSTEPRRLQVQDRPRHGRGLGLVARRQGAGRDRHGREQAHRQGHPMSPLKGLVSVAAILAAAGAGLWAGQTGLLRLPLRPSPTMAESKPEATGPVIYYRDPDGKPFYALEPKTADNGKAYVPVRGSEDVSLEPKPKDAPQVAAADASTTKKIKYYRNPMGLPDTSPVPKKRFDGDGLYPRLRRRGQR